MLACQFELVGHASQSSRFAGVAIPALGLVASRFHTHSRGTKKKKKKRKEKRKEKEEKKKKKMGLGGEGNHRKWGKTLPRISTCATHCWHAPTQRPMRLCTVSMVLHVCCLTMCASASPLACDARAPPMHRGAHLVCCAAVQRIALGPDQVCARFCCIAASIHFEIVQFLQAFQRNTRACFLEM